jgi:hypothetical protein
VVLSQAKLILIILEHDALSLRRTTAHLVIAIRNR